MEQSGVSRKNPALPKSLSEWLAEREAKLLLDRQLMPPPPPRTSTASRTSTPLPVASTPAASATSSAPKATSGAPTTPTSTTGWTVSRRPRFGQWLKQGASSSSSSKSAATTRAPTSSHRGSRDNVPEFDEYGECVGWYDDEDGLPEGVVQILPAPPVAKSVLPPPFKPKAEHEDPDEVFEEVDLAPRPRLTTEEAQRLWERHRDLLEQGDLAFEENRDDDRDKCYVEAAELREFLQSCRVGEGTRVRPIDLREEDKPPLPKRPRAAEPLRRMEAFRPPSPGPPLAVPGQDDGIEEAPLDAADVGTPAKPYKFRAREVALTLRRFPGTPQEVLALLQAKFPKVFAQRPQFVITREQHKQSFPGVTPWHIHIGLIAPKGERFQGTNEFQYKGVKYMAWVGKLEKRAAAGMVDPFRGWLEYCIKDQAEDAIKGNNPTMMLSSGIDWQNLDGLRTGLVKAILEARTVKQLLDGLVEHSTSEREAVRNFLPAKAIYDQLAKEDGSALLAPALQGAFADTHGYDARVNLLKEFFERYVFRRGAPFDRFKVFVLTGSSQLGKTVCVKSLAAGSAIWFNNSFNLNDYRRAYAHAKVCVFDDLEDGTPGSDTAPPAKFWCQSPDTEAVFTDKYTHKIRIKPLPLIIISNRVPYWARTEYWEANSLQLHFDRRERPLYQAAPPPSPEPAQVPPRSNVPVPRRL